MHSYDVENIEKANEHSAVLAFGLVLLHLYMTHEKERARETDKQQMTTTIISTVTILYHRIS